MRVLIRRLGKAIGELICLIPTFRYIRKRFPEAEITFEGDEYALSLLHGLPELDDIRPGRKSPGYRRHVQRQREKLRIGRPIREPDFDRAIDLQAAVHDYAESVNHRFEMERIDIYLEEAFEQLIPHMHQVEHPQKILDAADYTPSLALNAADRYEAGLWLQSNGVARQPVGIQLRSPDRQKAPATALWQETAEELKRRGCQVVTFDQDLRVPWAISCHGRPIRTVAAIIEQCALMIGPDSGLMHIAGAVNTPTVWLAGKTSVEALTKFYHRVIVLRKSEAMKEAGCLAPCYGVRDFRCGGDHPVKCLAAITAEDVTREAMRQLETYPPEEIKAPRLPEPEIRKYVVGQKSNPVASVIIPVLNHYQFTRDCLDSLRRIKDVPFEVIVIDNGVTEHRLKELLDDRRDFTLIRNAFNVGYGPANNQGARDARGEYLVLLNNDTVAEPGFIGNMLETFKRHPLAGAVGNKHLCNDGTQTHSAGSYWDEEQRNFLHRFFLQPADTHEAQMEAELNMATGACLMVRKSVFEQVGGFDEGYRICYCEDTDLCMKIRQAGWRIFYCPDSVIEHFGGGSRVRIPDRQANRERFLKQWIESGEFEKIRLQNEPFVVAGLIVLNEAEYLAPCIEAVYDFCNKIVIVEGGNEIARKAGLCNPQGHSQDATEAEIARIIAECDPCHKIVHVSGFWPTKTEQRQEYLAFIEPGQWLFVLDADDIYHPWQIAALRAEMMKGEAEAISFLRRTFWGRFDTWVDGRWDDYTPWTLIKWRRGLRMRSGCQLGDEHGRALHAVARTTRLPERLCSHYAYVRPLAKIAQKLAYYAAKGNAIPRNYMETFTDYVRGKIDHVAETHPLGGASPTHRFEGRHPEPIQRRIDSGEFDWGGAE